MAYFIFFFCISVCFLLFYIINFVSFHFINVFVPMSLRVAALPISSSQNAWYELFKFGDITFGVGSVGVNWEDCLSCVCILLSLSSLFVLCVPSSVFVQTVLCVCVFFYLCPDCLIVCLACSFFCLCPDCLSCVSSSVFVQTVSVFVLRVPSSPCPDCLSCVSSSIFVHTI